MVGQEKRRNQPRNVADARHHRLDGEQRIKTCATPPSEELIDIVVWDDRSRSTSKLALAPFSSSVYVGDYINALIDPKIVAAKKNNTRRPMRCRADRASRLFTDAAPADGAGSFPTT